jgi:hypothetical protein
LHPVAFSCPFPFALVGWLMLIGIVSSFGYLGCFWPSLSWIISRVGVLCPYCLFLRVLQNQWNRTINFT